MKNLTVAMHNNQRILTTAQIAEAYGTDTNNINVNFSRNKDRFTLGKHYFILEGKELKQFKSDNLTGRKVVDRVNKLYLWTEKGAALHAKLLNTDNAWQFYETLVDEYYRLIKEDRQPQPAQQPYVNADFVLRLRLNKDRVPYDHWTVLEQIDKESRHSGLGLVKLIDKARPDISVGKKWSNYLKKQGYDVRQFMMVPNIVNPGNMHEEDIRAYPLDMLPMFLRWLHTEYNEHFSKCYLPRRTQRKELA